MHEDQLIALAEWIAGCLCGQHEQLCLRLIRRLADGQPVSVTRLAADISMDEQAVRAVLRHMPDIEYDGDGNIIGFGMSLLPTAHQFITNGRTLYTWCALDTFMYTALLSDPAQVISDCPVSGVPITVTMTPTHIEQLAPVSSVISLVRPTRSIATCRRSAFCNHGHFFAAAEAAAHWQKTQPDAAIVSVADAHRLGRLLADRRLMRAEQRAWE